jgi:hypothetical protein
VRFIQAKAAKLEDAKHENHQRTEVAGKLGEAIVEVFGADGPG